MARAEAAAMTVRSETWLLAVKPIPSPLQKLRMQRFLSLPISANPGGSVIECGQATEVRSSMARGPGEDSAVISSARDATTVAGGFTGWFMRCSDRRSRTCAVRGDSLPSQYGRYGNGRTVTRSKQRLERYPMTQALLGASRAAAVVLDGIDNVFITELDDPERHSSSEAGLILLLEHNQLPAFWIGSP